MSSTPKRFTRYEAEFHAPETRYVLAEEHDTLTRAKEAAVSAADTVLTLYNNIRQELADARHELAMECMRHNATLAALRDERTNATRYPVENPANPLLTVEIGGIRYVLEVFSDEDDGEWFEVKSATPTEPLNIETFCWTTAFPIELTKAAREALRQWRETKRRDDEESRGV